MPQVVVSLTIAADEFIRLYQGSARSVYTTSIEGKKIRFPANILQPFVTRQGIKGLFAIEFGDQNKFIGIKRLE
jgi:hypothetical protein